MGTEPRNDTDGGQEPTPPGVELGRTLKRWREESNRSQNAVAKKLGARQPTVSRWEAGATLPTVEVIQALWRIRARPADTAPDDSDVELEQVLDLHRRAETERGRAPRPDSSRPAPVSASSPTAVAVPSAEAGTKRKAPAILAVSGVAVAVVLVVVFLVRHFAGSSQAGGTGLPSATAASARPAPRATCSGASCTSVEPTTTVCEQDAATAYTGRGYGVLVELRHSPRCHAAWARMHGTSPGDRVMLTFQHDEETSQEYRQQTGKTAHTPMAHVDDLAGVRACAIVEGRGTICATKAASSTAQP
ncbi:DUF2690 domain-containing protein [Streptomyces sp. NPDC047453]|uniref:DUF2690 domain-containing protein n=1 Tax=Streptomyces sp. NPDC047453 TaxID=3154812 RepID=UPI0033F48449